MLNAVWIYVENIHLFQIKISSTEPVCGYVLQPLLALVKTVKRLRLTGEVFQTLPEVLDLVFFNIANVRHQVRHLGKRNVISRIAQHVSRLGYETHFSSAVRHLFVHVVTAEYRIH
jgi:hypothetical protein